MKNFIQYLTETQKTYEFKIKIANLDPSEFWQDIKDILETYGLESLSKPKSHPIKADCIDFPSIKNCQLFVMDIALSYPMNNDQIRNIISERTKLLPAQIVVVPRNQPEELRRWHPEESDIHQFKQGESVLDKPYEEVKGGKEAGKFYSDAGTIFKEFNKEPKWEIAGHDNAGADGKTTNEIPVSDTSPIGTKRTKIPAVVKGSK